MKKLACVAVATLLLTACGDMLGGAEDTAEGVGSATGGPAAGSMADMHAEELVLNIPEATVNDIAGYWWTDGDYYETFRNGIYYRRFINDGDWFDDPFQTVTSCEDQTANPDGRGMAIVEGSCFDVNAVTDNVFVMMEGTYRYEETRISGEVAQQLEAELARFVASN